MLQQRIVSIASNVQKQQKSKKNYTSTIKKNTKITKNLSKNLKITKPKNKTRAPSKRKQKNTSCKRNKKEKLLNKQLTVTKYYTNVEFELPQNDNKQTGIDEKTETVSCNDVTVSNVKVEETKFLLQNHSDLCTDSVQTDLGQNNLEMSNNNSSDSEDSEKSNIILKINKSKLSNGFFKNILKKKNTIYSSGGSESFSVEGKVLFHAFHYNIIIHTIVLFCVRYAVIAL